jgi:hypothetical protein
MAIILNDNLRINAPKPSEERYLKPDNTPYSSIAEVNSLITVSRRYIGLTVRILNEEYWYKDGTADGDLILKSSGTSLPPGTLIGNILTWNGTDWVDTIPNFENKKNFLIFTNQTVITVTHGEGEAQHITIIDPTGEDISNAGYITQSPYPNPTQFTVEFNTPVSGIIYYN